MRLEGKLSCNLLAKAGKEEQRILGKIVNFTQITPLSNTMKNNVIDCFTFFNELDLLEIRLKYLYDTLDYFAIVEADQTFSGENKSYVLEEHWERFRPYHPKMVYVQLKIKSFEAKRKVAWKRE